MSQGLGNETLYKTTMPLTLRKSFRYPNPLIMPKSTTHVFKVYPWRYASKSLGLGALDMVKVGEVNLRP